MIAGGDHEAPIRIEERRVGTAPNLGKLGHVWVAISGEDCLHQVSRWVRVIKGVPDLREPFTGLDEVHSPREFSLETGGYQFFEFALAVVTDAHNDSSA